MNLAFIQGIGATELIIVLVVVLLIFGPKRLPSLARSMGTGMREFKDSLTSKGDDDDTPIAKRSELGHTDEPASAPDPSPEPASADASEARPAEGEPVPERR